MGEFVSEVDGDTAVGRAVRGFGPLSVNVMYEYSKLPVMLSATNTTMFSCVKYINPYPNKVLSN